MYILLSLLFMVLFVGALVDIIIVDQARVRHLPKIFWIIIVILLPSVGSILWFAIGREYVQRIARPRFSGWQDRGEGQDVGERAQPGRDVAPLPLESGGHSPGVYGLRNTEAELEALEREISAYEKAERIRQLEAELESRRGKSSDPE